MADAGGLTRTTCRGAYAALSFDAPPVYVAELIRTDAPDGPIHDRDWLSAACQISIRAPAARPSRTTIKWSSFESPASSRAEPRKGNDMKKSWWFGSIVVVIVFLWSPMLLAEAENQDPGPSDPWYCSWIGCDDGYHWWCPGSCRGGQTPSMRTCSEQATGETDEQRLERAA